MIIMNPNEAVVVASSLSLNEIAEVVWVKRSPPVGSLDAINARIMEGYDDLLKSAEKNTRRLIGRDRL